MLDQVGLLGAGNEELCQFAWSAFSKWQARRGGRSLEARRKEREMYNFMKNFRETFSRPVRSIRFLGLFDTVNSVPRFENPWLQRTKFPYTAESSAKIIRHAVSIDERRAKFRQDLISERRGRGEYGLTGVQPYQSDLPTVAQSDGDDAGSRIIKEITGFIEASNSHQSLNEALPPMSTSTESVAKHSLEQDNALARLAEMSRQKSHRSDVHVTFAGSAKSTPTENLTGVRRTQSERTPRFSDLSKSQDIEEVWFLGGHGDVDGGWPKVLGEK